MIATAEPATSDANPGRAASARRNSTTAPYDERRTSAEAFGQAVRGRVAGRTWGRLRQLQVEAGAQYVRVRGSSPTYYLKQLALAAVREALPGAGVELDIRVVQGELGLAPAGSRRADLLAQKPRSQSVMPARRFCRGS